MGRRESRVSRGVGCGQEIEQSEQGSGTWAGERAEGAGEWDMSRREREQSEQGSGMWAGEREQSEQGSGT